jgi:RND family efflux transporter MFP subunit
VALAAHQVEIAEDALATAEDPPPAGPEQVAAATAAVTAAEQAVAAAERAAAGLVVTAPLDGTVTQVAAAVGQVVAPGTVLAVVQASSLQLQAVVSPAVADDLTGVIGASARVVETGPGAAAATTGTVRAVTPTGSGTTQAFSALVEIAEAAPGLRPGDPATATVPLRAVAVTDGGFEVPAEAVVHPDGEPVVFVATPGPAGDVELPAGAVVATVRRTPVDVGAQTAVTVEVLSGLSAGDQVVVTGQTYLADGARVVAFRGGS